ncbi:uncharacterized protein LOC119390910 [Rhipicephalus sanguineus]|uniref:uncharacterized protein LOC119390910 n=1 Tax=Rhipicephalus sanguineus TaxID=34632 RepID=UPI0018935733|nr:uncharacterized protein LOC119390910 [Rhipicephalus sanguineus]
MKEQEDENGKIAAADTIIQLHHFNVPEIAHTAASEERLWSSRTEAPNSPYTGIELQEPCMPETDLGPAFGEQNKDTEVQDSQHRVGGHQEQCVQTRNQSTQWEDSPHDDHTYVQHLPIGFKGKSVSESLSRDDIVFYTGLSETIFGNL